MTRERPCKVTDKCPTTPVYAVSAFGVSHETFEPIDTCLRHLTTAVRTARKASTSVLLKGIVQ